MRSRARSRRLIGLGMAAVLAFGLTACGDDDDDVASTTTAAASGETTTTEADAAAEWEQVVTDAEAEGTVLLYTVTTQSTLDQVEVAFEQAYPNIDLQFFRGNTGEVVTRITTERQSGNIAADMILINQDGTPTTIETFDRDGLLAEPAGPSFQDDEVQHAIADNHFFVYVTVFGWAWNTQVYPDGIDSWEDFLDPALNGKVGAFDPVQSSLIPACYDQQVEAAGPNFLTDFAAQEPRIYPGGQAQEAALAAGEIAATPWATKRILQAQQQGAPVDYAVPPEGACVPATEGAILADAPHPNAAQVFADWLLSEEGQAVFLVQATPARSGVPGTDVEFADLEPTTPANAEAHQAFIAEFDQLFR
jgi:iron(III) transport system substrate-binding protein